MWIANSVSFWLLKRVVKHTERQETEPRVLFNQSFNNITYTYSFQSRKKTICDDPAFEKKREICDKNAWKIIFIELTKRIERYTESKSNYWNAENCFVRVVIVCVCIHGNRERKKNRNGQSEKICKNKAKNRWLCGALNVLAVRKMWSEYRFMNPKREFSKGIFVCISNDDDDNNSRERPESLDKNLHLPWQMQICWNEKYARIANWCII